MCGLNIQVESAALHFIKLSGANEASSVPTDKHNYCKLCSFLWSEQMGWRGEMWALLPSEGSVVLLSVQLSGWILRNWQWVFCTLKLSSYPDLTANFMSPPMSAPTPGDIKPKCFQSTGQQQLPPYRGRSKSLERGLQSKELVSPTCQQATLVWYIW